MNFPKQGRGAGQRFWENMFGDYHSTVITTDSLFKTFHEIPDLHFNVLSNPNYVLMVFKRAKAEPATEPAAKRAKPNIGKRANKGKGKAKGKGNAKGSETDGSGADTEGEGNGELEFPEVTNIITFLIIHPFFFGSLIKNKN